ncbi:hypothetical protein B0H63DRAFT_558330 [Podospora didyma]|uniref:LysM domain-containing protein n=1 Tax=Podospora didyma TaxID=330526 RepID=A0AAE0NS19_9PEZI|nr:hypothetical protein B0H63DRAFT_558330 [Podospora didyma]
MFLSAAVLVLAGAALAIPAGDEILTPARRILPRVTTLTSPTGPQQSGTIATCNKWYNVVSGDTCSSVEAAFGITHAQFLQWNPAVSSDCSQNFWLGDTYCVGVSSASSHASSTTSTKSSSTSSRGSSTSSSAATGAQSTPGAPTMSGIPCNCNKYYTIVSGDTCGTVETRFGITHAQFLLWNPTVSSDCANNFWLGEAYCVGVNTAVTACPSTTSKPPTGTGPISTSIPPNTEPYSMITGDISASQAPRPTATGFPPSPTVSGTSGHCLRYYQANPGDTCQGLVNRYARFISMSDFLNLNPGAGTDAASCQVFVNYYYCVDAPYSTTLPPATTTIFPTFTTTDLPALNSTYDVPQPTAPGAVSNCMSWYQAAAGDTCNSVASFFGYLSVAEIQAWNTGVNCGSQLISGDNYCVAYFPAGSSPPLPSTVSTPPSPTQTGIISTCKGWYLASSGDTCDLITQMFGTFTEANFLSWNPALGSSCSGLVVGNYYCIAVPGTPTTRTASTPPTSLPSNGVGPQPEQPGIPTDCLAYWLVSSSDNCTTIAQANDISENQLEAWNPALGSGCTHLLPDYFICVSASEPGVTTSVPGSTALTASRTSSTPFPSSSSRASSTTTTSTTSITITTPTPVQTSMAAQCNRFYKVEPGDGCFAIAAAANIQLTTFYALNPAVGTDCSGLLSGFYVCLGVVSDGAPATTISTGTPVAATPAPTQTGMAKGCTRFYLVESGDSCGGIAAAAGISLANFQAWNPAVGAGCTGLLSGFYACIGGPGATGVVRGTTITSGAPVPAPTS